MISQRKGEFPPVAFMLIHKDAPGFSLESTIAGKGDHFVLENLSSGAKLMVWRAIGFSLEVFVITLPGASQVSVHEKLASQITEKADQLNKRMNDELLTRKHAMDTLQTNFPFLTVDECDMLLDLFAQAIEEFFKSEYVVE
ncbi:hypothetical protein GQ600_24736 [Phytophthora cactorum]|nr:hypothetical protein GQ600_24736 [Phytophthora cactorum]